MSKGKYGEPWRVETGWNRLKSDGSSHWSVETCRISSLSDQDCVLAADQPYADRLIACVNALDGVKDPEDFVHKIREAAKQNCFGNTVLALVLLSEASADLDVGVPLKNKEVAYLDFSDGDYLVCVRDVMGKQTTKATRYGSKEACQRALYSFYEKQEDLKG